METPSSIRRVTRSQTSVTCQKDSLPRSRNAGNPDRSALIDITNDSPIVGVAIGSLAEKTPSSSLGKSQVKAKNTPGSGEALLRGQVKTLLQKVEEEAELVKFPPSSGGLLGLLGCSSPALLLAPTPANTPQIASISDTLMPSVKEEDDQKIVESLKQEEPLDPLKGLINRALLFDSPGKSESSATPTVQESESSNSVDGDNSSAWSLQVNTSIQEDGEEGAEDFEEEEEDFEGLEEETEEYGEEETEEECFDDLCEGLRMMAVDDKVRLPEFTGKHTRFIYNSDDEIEGEEEISRE